ncbi:MAG: zf-HC2 domain-containing protein, partial [Terrabacter sp.]
GMTANAVSVRAMRAREALRAGYLDARAARGLAAADSDECRWTVEHLGAFVRGRLPKRQTERARAHVEACPHAAALAAELRVIHEGFPALLVPVVLAAGLVTPGFVTGGAVAALSTATTAASGGTAVASASATDHTSAGARAVDAVAQLAGRATNLAAALAVTAGLATTLSVPAPSFADSTLPAPRPSTPAMGPATPLDPAKAGPGRPTPATSRHVSGAADPTALPSRTGTIGVRGATGQEPRARDLSHGMEGAAPPVSGDTRVGVASPGSARPAATLPPSATAAQPPGASGTPAPARPPATTPQTTPTTSEAPPPSDPGPTGDVPAVSVHLVNVGESARVSVRVRAVATAGLTVRIGNLAGTGRLTVRNSSWDCAQADRATVSCSGGRGSAVLDQSGTGGVVPLVVRVSDASGRAWTETIRPSPRVDQ